MLSFLFNIGLSTLTHLPARGVAWGFARPTIHRRADRGHKAPSYRLCLFQHGPRPGGHVGAIGFGIVRADIENRPRPRGFGDNWQSISGFYFEFALATINDILVLLSDKSRRFIFNQKFFQ